MPGAGPLEHRTFRDLPALLRKGDVLVLNETRVIRARLRGRRQPGGGSAQFLLLAPLGSDRYDAQAKRWTALARPGRALREGARVQLGAGAHAEVTAVHADGIREITIQCEGTIGDLLERAGEVPTPPYIGAPSAAALAGYQTVFARVPGSVAAPTASLHFTQEILDRVAAHGVEIVRLVLDVGLGTFKPIETERIDEHVMHTEHYEIPAETAEAIRRAKREGRRVVAAGTTVVRALEGAAAHGALRAGEGATALFITPGFQFQLVDALLTNFHLPRSTLLVLVSAFAGIAPIAAAYAEAIAQRYRFYSFGDAMFVESGPAVRAPTADARSCSRRPR